MTQDKIIADLETICAPGDRRAYVEQVLQENEVRYQKLTYRGDTVNFVITFGPMWTWKTVYGAHYDRVPEAPGANDNGASVICLIHLAAKLQAEGYTGPLAIVLFDREEPCNRIKGDSGSYFFGKTLSKRKLQPELFVILDVIGYGDQLFVDSYGDWQMEEMIRHVSPNLKTKATPGSDDTCLDQADINSVLLCVLPKKEFSQSYPMAWNLLHTRNDSVKTVDPDSVAWVGRVLHSLIQPKRPLVEDVPAYVNREDSGVEPWEDFNAEDEFDTFFDIDDYDDDWDHWEEFERLQEAEHDAQAQLEMDFEGKDFPA